jgi:hypothetical protein
MIRRSAAQLQGLALLLPTASALWQSFGMRGLVSVGRALLALLLIALGPNGARAETDVDLELVLAVDISFSMDYEEQRLQRDGYIGAFRDPQIIKAIQSGVQGRIAVTYVEWAGPETQNVVIPWTLIDGPAAAEAFAVKLETQAITRARMTSISSALTFAGTLLRSNEFRGARRVIDVSGDGANNAGPPLAPVRDDLIKEGVVINGLPILLRPGTAWSTFDIADLDVYYSSCVIGGSGSFMIPIKEKAEFSTATRQKLLIEVSGIMAEPRVMHAQLAGPEPGFDCMIGEKLWQRNFDRWRP